jgi:FdhE protein
LSPLTRDGWLEAHPYLRPIGEFSARVERATSERVPENASIPDWNEYRDEYLAGVPLLQSAEAPIDLELVGSSIESLVQWMASDAMAGKRAEEAAALDTELRRVTDSPRRIVSWLLGDDAWAPPSSGLLRYLGWTALSRFLRPLVDAFGLWRDEERWLRNYCPTCGSGPAMAQMIGKDAARRRLLICGRCATGWAYKRTQCPFCENDSDRVAIVAIEGEAGLRIDHCASCRGYLKTYDGQQDPGLLLSDWSSLHLDLIARDRGMSRLAVSLYALDDEPAVRG